MEENQPLASPQGPLKAHILVDGTLHRACMGCRVRPVPRGFCCILLCDECLRARGKEHDRRAAETRERINELCEAGMPAEDAAKAVGVNRWTGLLLTGTRWEEIVAMQAREQERA